MYVDCPKFLTYCLCLFVIGTGKSQFLKFAAKLCNRSVITTGLGSTSAGLTVTAVKDGGNFDTALFYTATVSFSIIIPLQQYIFGILFVTDVALFCKIMFLLHVADLNSIEHHFWTLNT